MRRMLWITVAILAAVLFVNPATANAALKVECKPSVGFANADPIVGHNSKAPSEHTHEFFGNGTLLRLANPQAATYDQLVGQPSVCSQVGDSAVYWAPALLANGQPLHAARFSAYYRAYNQQDVGEAQAFPADLRMVTGQYDWSCGQYSNTVQKSAIPDCSKATGKVIYLTVRYTFPSCWDGKLNSHTTAGDTTDYAPSGMTNHLAFYGKGRTCPAGFPIKLPQLRETISWGDGTAAYWQGKAGLRLASDMDGTSAGSSSHADFWNTWQQDQLAALISRCVNSSGGGASCG